MIINLILLASGKSSRFGTKEENKLLYKIQGTPMYRHILSAALELQEKREERVRIILVTAYEEIRTAVQGADGFSPYQQEEIEGWKKGCFFTDRVFVKNKNQEEGISYSIKLGIQAAALESEEDCLLFTVCDQPYLPCRELEYFIEGFHRSGKGIGCMAYEGQSGNPVIFKSKYKLELLALSKDTGGKNVLKAHLTDVFFYEVKEERALFDIDIKERVENP